MTRPTTRISSSFALAAALCLLPLGACGPKKVYTDADVPTLPSLSEVMFAQTQAIGPVFKKKKEGTPFTDADYAQMGAAATRLKLTSAKMKSSFSQGPDFNGFADQLAKDADDLAAAGAARDSAKAIAALNETGATCGGCHRKFR